MSRFLPGQIEVVVGSYGGSGSTFLLNFLSRYKPVNDARDRDGLKHLPVPPVSFNPHIRCVYIYRDPAAAVRSIFSRRFQHLQFRKLNRCGHLAFPAVTRQETLAGFAAAGRDRFRLQEHFHNWYSHDLVHPTLFIRYETLWDHLGPLLDFLELPAAAAADFPGRVIRPPERCLAGPDIAGDVMEQLGRIYETFRRELNRCPGVEIRGKHFAGKRSHLPFTRNFRLALLHSAKQPVKHWRDRLRERGWWPGRSIPEQTGEPVRERPENEP